MLEVGSHKSVAIYGLTDPVSGELRYVGKTTQPLSARYAQHIYSRGVHKITKCASWIVNLRRRNLKPDLFLIEEVKEEDWKEAEAFWIANFRYLGADLCNLSDGGQGTHGYKLSEEHKRKLADAGRGRKLSEEGRKKVAQAKIGKSRPDLSQRNVRNAKLNAEQVAKIRDYQYKGRDLAKEFGISPTTVCNIRKGLIYKRFVPSPF